MKIERSSIILFVLFSALQLLGCGSIESKDASTKQSGEIKESVVSINGTLQAKGASIVNKHGEIITLHGMSLFWSQWGGKYYNSNVIKTLKNQWNCNIVRAALGVEGGGYLENKKFEKDKIISVIDACIEGGIYVIVDWHDHHAENHVDAAKEFFAEIAQKYSGHANIIYELYNEPLQVSWSKVIKPYANEVIAKIREYDKANLIIVGTPNWSQFVDEAASDPVDDKNVAYSLHFYTSTHSQWLRDRANKAIELGVPLFVTEFGISEASGDGKIDYEETKKWIKFSDENNLSWCNWSIMDKNESSAALVGGANPEGNWGDDQLTESGKYIKNLITTKNNIE